MRLWHVDLIKYLPRQQLLGQHRECCALRGNGWGTNHKVVNYVWEYSPLVLYRYHKRIMIEMGKRGYNVDITWLRPRYRGKFCSEWLFHDMQFGKNTIGFAEHSPEYLQACLDNLKMKKAVLLGGYIDGGSVGYEIQA